MGVNTGDTLFVLNSPNSFLKWADQRNVRAPFSTHPSMDPYQCSYYLIQFDGRNVTVRLGDQEGTLSVLEMHTGRCGMNQMRGSVQHTDFTPIMVLSGKMAARIRHNVRSKMSFFVWRCLNCCSMRSDALYCGQKLLKFDDFLRCRVCGQTNEKLNRKCTCCKRPLADGPPGYKFGESQHRTAAVPTRFSHAFVAVVQAKWELRNVPSQREKLPLHAGNTRSTSAAKTHMRCMRPPTKQPNRKRLTRRDLRHK